MTATNPTAPLNLAQYHPRLVRTVGTVHPTPAGTAAKWFATPIRVTVAGGLGPGELRGVTADGWAIVHLDRDPRPGTEFEYPAADVFFADGRTPTTSIARA